MRPTFGIAAALSTLLAMGSPVAAQQVADRSVPAAATASVPKATPVDDTATAAGAARAAAESSWKKGRPITLQYFRPLDQRGINVFETMKAPGVEFTGFKLDFG